MWEAVGRKISKTHFTMESFLTTPKAANRGKLCTKVVSVQERNAGRERRDAGREERHSGRGGGRDAGQGWLILSCSVLCAFNSSPPALLKLIPHSSPSSSLVIAHPGDLGILLCHQELTLMQRSKVGPQAYQHSTFLPYLCITIYLCGSLSSYSDTQLVDDGRQIWSHQRTEPVAVRRMNRTTQSVPMAKLSLFLEILWAFYELLWVSGNRDFIE